MTMATDASPPDSATFRLPSDAAKPQAERRTWEGYASDFRDLTMRFATLQQAHEALRDEHAGLGTRYDVLQRQRHDDQGRFASLMRARVALEANSGAQATRTRIAQNALAARDATIARTEAERDAAEAERARLSGTVEAMQLAIATLRETSGAQSAEPDALAVDHTSRASDNAPGNRIPVLRVSSASDPSPLDRVLASLALRRARQAARRRDWARAEALYTVVLMTRDEPRIWVQLGHALREQGMFTAAGDAYEQALGRGLPDGEIYVMRGLSAAGDGDAVGAREAYRQALQRDPTLRGIYAELRDFHEAN